jgi:hypothetical protein
VSSVLHSITYLLFREKHELVRNDFLDCMMELRNRGRSEVEKDKLSSRSAKEHATFRKLQINVITKDTEKTPGNTQLRLCGEIYICLESPPNISCRCTE